MSYCHVSKQIADHANQPEAQRFGELNEWEQECIVSELADRVLNNKASLSWVEYPHTITLEFAMQSLLEEAEFIEELANSVLNTSSAKTLLINSRKAETKGLIKHALDTCGIAPEGYDFDALLLEDAA
jgi:hypothetical protein